MQPEERDAAYLWDMMDSAKEIQIFVRGVSFEQYLQDRKLQLAVERAVEIIGEAARRISDDFKKAHLEIQWRRIVGLRNVLAHEYGEIKQERMWIVATENIPELILQLKTLIPESPQE
ncbi:MAG: DUF86 domain-containing protein [Candidatus Schekmanbacteria bacterium]|nr:DUF86 domain-containing protein [Candidatus Schekmanbacteria bacterium]